MAKLKVFTVYDSKVEAYAQPFFCRTIGEALRSWEGACNDGQSMMSKHPGDFTLFEVAEFDEKTGTFHPRETKNNLGLAIEQKRSAAPAPLDRPRAI
ncbi:nonstructural protein [Apis mellifera associated microvirus 18]|nr:nonstructural protein [Apis mellifera associated microvirus 18]